MSALGAIAWWRDQRPLSWLLGFLWFVGVGQAIGGPWVGWVKILVVLGYFGTGFLGAYLVGMVLAGMHFRKTFS